MSNLRSIKKVNKQNCFSCRSCFLICPIQAISMEETKEGFFFPKVSDQCTNCGLCSIHCPSLNPIIENNFKKESYAAYLNNSELLHRSSSGGLFAGFAKKIIDDGGVVFGAAYDNNLFVNQIVAFNHNEVEQIKESKYLESNTNSSFSQVKELLSQYTVLYSGCPCQIAGLKKFLGKEYFNLITIDLICHGVPSQKLFHKYLQFKESEFGDKIFLTSSEIKNLVVIASNMLQQ
jgi:coenzyme F420-reducing hydrogenase beta subunit